MPIVVRRSNLLVPLRDGDRVRSAWRHGADAITLDMANRDSAPPMSMEAAIASAAQGAAEVFARVDARGLPGNLETIVRPGLSGLVLVNVQAAGDVVSAAETVSQLERVHGLAAGRLCFVLLLASARAVWHVRSIIAASPRVSQVGLDERALAADLSIDAVPEYDPFDYARGRLVVEATAAKVSAIGLAYPHSVHASANVSQDEIRTAASRAKNLGMKGVLCTAPSWVEPVNAAFTPTAEQVAWNRRVREAFAAGVAAGTAAVPLEGRMIDVPVDEWAKVVIAMADACGARDAQKRAALVRAQERA
jgi:citrate lyase subunit beta/citryl-CoA lyase